MEICRVFQFERRGIGGWQLRRCACQCGVRDRLAGFGVGHLAAAGRQHLCRNAPLRCCSGDQHRARRRSSLPHGQPFTRGRPAAACALPAENLGVGMGLFDADLRPVDVQFLRDEHRQHRLGALADFSIFRADDDAIVRQDADEGVDDDRRAVRRLRDRHGKIEQQSAARDQ